MFEVKIEDLKPGVYETLMEMELADFSQLLATIPESIGEAVSNGGSYD